jgi:hypothetical protein
MVQKSLLGTDRTIADGDAFYCHVGFEADLPAMATAFVMIHALRLR